MLRWIIKIALLVIGITLIIFSFVIRYGYNKELLLSIGSDLTVITFVFIIFDLVKDNKPAASAEIEKKPNRAKSTKGALAGKGVNQNSTFNDTRDFDDG